MCSLSENTCNFKLYHRSSNKEVCNEAMIQIVIYRMHKISPAWHNTLHSNSLLDTFLLFQTL